MRPSRRALLATLAAIAFAVLAAAPVRAQLVGTDTAPGESCAGVAPGATRMTADADQDGKEVTLICDGSVWQPASGGVSALPDLTDIDDALAPSDGQVLMYSAGSGKWTSGDSSAAAKNVAQLTTTNTTLDINQTSPVAIPWDTPLYLDSGYTHSAVTNPERITFNSAGTYLVSVTLAFEGAAVRGNPGVKFRLNGAAVLEGHGMGGYLRATSGHDEASSTLTRMIDANAGDYLEVITQQMAAAGTINLRTGESVLFIEQLSAVVPLSQSLALNDLTDVNAPSPADTDCLKYDNASGRWTPDSCGGAAAGNTGEIQFNNGDAFAASADLFWDNADGRLGIGTASPQAALDLAGGVKLGYDSGACNASKEGAIRYDSSTKSFEGCDGVAWNALGGATTLAALSDTEITNPQDGQPLVYDSASAKWINNACDEAPDSLNFTDLVDQSTSTLVSSNIIQIAGIGCSVDVSITGDGTPEYRICSASDCSAVTTDWTVAVNPLNAGDYLQLRLTTSASQDTTHTATVTIGTGSANWNVKTIGPKRVFVTSQTYSGNLGGLSGADSKCQARADAAGLVGTFKAWLSDSTTSASDRLTHATVAYVRVDGTKIADNWTDLTDGTALDPVDSSGVKLDENGVVRSSPVWTNTTTAGAIKSAANNCQNWTDGAWPQTPGTTGWTDDGTTPNWTDIGDDFCDGSYRLFCFEQ